jgi:branched-subunit amino acid transport protein AzlD
MTAWIALIVASLMTLALRAGPSLIRSGLARPETLQRANRFVPPALMGALVMRGAAAQAAATGAAAIVAALAVAAPIAFRTRSTGLTVGAGAATCLAAAAIFS